MPTTVCIFTASIGAGHDVPAQVLAAGLRERGADAEVVDGLALAGPVARTMLGGVPASGSAPATLLFEARYLLGTRLPTRAAGAAVVDRLVRGRFAAHLAAHPADIVVSTYPLWSELLGRMRLDGALDSPAVSAITDLAALRHWAHPGIDLHLLTHPASEAEARAIAGPRPRIEAVHGLTSDPRFTDPPERNVAREELGLPTRGSLVVVSGGGWAVGDLTGATDTALHYGANTVVVLVGHNEGVRAKLEAAYGGDERVQVWGFTDRMVLLLCAADVLIHATAGLTVLEALMCDCRVISYGWPRGHIRANDRAYERLDMVAVAKNRPQLAHALVHALAAPPLGPQLPDLPAAADVVLELAAREPAHAG
jgi:UDP-N-acetylglucosamine:LPS N-acetylglucosamine transferase